uniref:Dynein axonemal intermediate chain 7 n=1 Tax=Latimeria chalumnae TaxID=7897 RepID=M3XKV7_LATCH|nr:PREDICTED: protein CASC1 isoform X1 [Latimeria chalumnae]|eukprot:XP_005992340.2 PREDICTED: protein CASC1 isoform X1 [Latimeria chalumnae]
MPPKKGQSTTGSAGASKKGKKLSKAERERLKKEEEERRHIEEEEARLKAEKEEAERLERERQAKEERERLEIKERECRNDELAELRQLIEGKLIAAKTTHSKNRAIVKRNRYMLCDGSPDPAIPQEINTFINLWRESKDVNIKTVLDKSKTVLILISELEFLLSNTPASELNESQATQYRSTILELQKVLLEKYNEATKYMLMRASAMANIETGYMETVIVDENITLCLWANLSRNSRFKGCNFSENKISFELPKPLTVCAIAVRIFHARYDHLSNLCHTFYPRKKRIPLVGESEINQSEKKEEEERPTEEGPMEGKEFPPVTEDETKLEDTEGVMAVQDSASVKEVTKNLVDEKEKIEELDKKTEEALEEAVAELEEEEEEEEILENDVVDLRQYITLGGVYYFDLVKLPPQPKQIKGWTIVELLDSGLEFFPYPSETLKNNSSNVKIEEKENETLALPPVGVTIKLPENVMFFETPQIARWDNTGKQWKTDCISNLVYDEENKMMSFRMNTFYHFTLIQDTHLNMPYQSWELRPNNNNEAVLTVFAALIEIEIQIRHDHCQLNSLLGEENNRLSEIKGKWMTPQALITAMKNVGVNIFPAQDTYKYVSIIAKDQHAEQAAYEQMSLLSPAFGFSWSKWNLKAGYHHIVLKVSEHLKPGLIANRDWSLYMLSAERIQKLKITEFSEKFSDDLANGSEFHSSLYHMFKDVASSTAIDRIKSADPLFVDCVLQLLKAIRVLTFS